MPDWKRIIVGDAFRLPSRNVNYYRDLFLVWPFLLFTIAALANIFGGSHDHRLGLKLSALSVLTLARERLVLLSGGLGFCAVQSLVSFALRHDWVGLVVGILTGALFLMLILALKDHKFSYQSPSGMKLVDVLVGLLSLGLSIIVLRWVDS